MVTLEETFEVVKFSPMHIVSFVKLVRTGSVHSQVVSYSVTISSTWQSEELKTLTVYCWEVLGLGKLLTMTPPIGIVVEPLE